MKKEYLECKNCPKFKEKLDYGVYCQLKDHTIYSALFFEEDTEYVWCMGY